jgi:hypothetical protein
MPLMLKVLMRAHVGDLSRAAWDGLLLPRATENWDFYRAAETVPPPGFELGAMAAVEEGTVLAVAPTFRTTYRLDTPFQGAVRAFAEWVHRVWPERVAKPIIGIGSPMSDNCHIGFAPSLTAERRRHLFAAILRRLQAEAEAEHAWMMLIKGLDETQAEQLEPAFAEIGWRRMTSLPIVKLRLPFAGMEEFMASLPKKTAGYLRRKVKGAARFRIEHRHTIDGIEADVYRLFEGTIAHSGTNYGDFEGLHPEYFHNVVAALGDRALVTLIWRGDELLSFAFSIVADGVIAAKQIGMKYPEASEHNLYFLNWMELIEYALEHGIEAIEMGATTYAAKLLFGGRLERRWLFVRFRSPVSRILWNPLTPLFDFERNSPELEDLRRRPSMAGAVPPPPARGFPAPG